MRGSSISGQAELSRHRKFAEENPNSANAYLKLGTALVKVGFLGEGQVALERAVRLDPQDARAWVNLGGVRLSRWDFAGCVEANQRALDCDPDLKQAHFNQGLGYLYLGDAEKMLGCFQRVLELDPESSGGNYHLAVALRAVGRVNEARFYLAKAIELGYAPDPGLIKALEEADSRHPVQIYEFGPSEEGDVVKEQNKEAGD